MALHGVSFRLGASFMAFTRHTPGRAAPGGADGRARPSTSFSHDSIGLGEDGPTISRSKHLAALRGYPELAACGDPAGRGRDRRNAGRRQLAGVAFAPSI